MSKIEHRRQYDFTALHDAFPYQHEAFLALKDKDYAAIFHEQGLGKTKIAIDLLLYWLQYRDIDTVLIVTKKQLVSNWCDEFHVHTKLQPKVLTNNRSENFYVFNSSTRVIVTNFETISTEKERVQLFLKSRDVAIIIDESTKIKNPESKLTKDFFEISELFKIRLIMTGTPIANRPYDIWSQIFFLDGGESLGVNFSEFKSRTDLSNDLKESVEKRNEFEDTVGSIFSRISSFSVRETKNSGIVQLPTKIYHDIFIPFEIGQQQMYEQLRTELVLSVQKGDKVIMDESQESIKRLLRLVQIASNPHLVDESYDALSAKERYLDQLLKNILTKKEQVIVWSIFTGNIDSFTRRYSSMGAVKITGKMSINDRNDSVRKFKSGEARILFATPQSAKEGLTLTVANNAVFYDRGFNLDDYLQAQDRIHRISQKKDCHIYNLMVEDSIDIWVSELLKAKQNAAFLGQGDFNISQYKKIADYSFSDLVKQILNID